MIEPGYAYIRITQFPEQIGESLAQAIKTLFTGNSNDMKGLILDLRNDPGGLLNGAVAVSAAFLPENALVVYTEGRSPDAKMKLHANPEYYLRGPDEDFLKGLPAAVKTVPMITPVNGGSASASEIVAGALQDHKRSIVMGSQTFGKGSVQTILPLGNNTAIKLSTARYYTPNGQSIQAKGITPDVLDETDSGDDERLRESDLNRHLSDGKKTEKKTQAAPIVPSTRPTSTTLEMPLLVTTGGASPVPPAEPGAVDGAGKTLVMTAVAAPDEATDGGGAPVVDLGPPPAEAIPEELADDGRRTTVMAAVEIEAIFAASADATPADGGDDEAAPASGGGDKKKPARGKRKRGR